MQAHMSTSSTIRIVRRRRHRHRQQRELMVVVAAVVSKTAVGRSFGWLILILADTMRSFCATTTAIYVGRK